MKKLKLITSCFVISCFYFHQIIAQTSVASGLNWVTTGGVTSGCPCSASSITALGATGQGGCIKLQTGSTSSGPGGDIYMLLGGGPNGMGRFLIGTSTSSTPLVISSTGNIITTGSVATAGISIAGAGLDLNDTYKKFVIGADYTNYNANYFDGALNPSGSKMPFYFKWRGDQFSSSALTILGNGNIGIGCVNPTVKLAVSGKIQATEIEIKSAPCSDYVFESNYKLMKLSEVEQFVSTHKHLPEVPSAKEFEENGYSVGQMDDLLLRKVEELTLYMIELKKENKELKNEIEKIKSTK